MGAAAGGFLERMKQRDVESAGAGGVDAVPNPIGTSYPGSTWIARRSAGISRSSCRSSAYVR
jgi:hypothetical protein